jgi:hypothetical protein
VHHKSAHSQKRRKRLRRAEKERERRKKERERDKIGADRVIPLPLQAELAVSHVHPASTYSYLGFLWQGNQFILTDIVQLLGYKSAIG